MKSIRFSRAFVFFIGFGVFSGVALAQSPYQSRHEQGTTLGISQNSSQDLANSLVVNNKPKVGKGEKKEDVDVKSLQSKKTHDTTFSGSLNDIGLDWTGDKMGKPHGGGAAAPNAVQSSGSAEKDLKASKSADASDEAQTKEQRSTLSKSDDKAAEKQGGKQKSSDSDR
jgi:hypothetical protein